MVQMLWDHTWLVAAMEQVGFGHLTRVQNLCPTALALNQPQLVTDLCPPNLFPSSLGQLSREHGYYSEG